jgi:hypothetical protein
MDGDAQGRNAPQARNTMLKMELENGHVNARHTSLAGPTSVSSVNAIRVSLSVTSEPSAISVTGERGEPHPTTLVHWTLPCSLRLTSYSEYWLLQGARSKQGRTGGVTG